MLVIPFPAIDPEVFLVDEVLSVGDMAFQHKARRRMWEMMAKAQLMVMVSHDLEAIESVCNRAVWLDHGKILHDGPVAETIAAYRASVQAAPPPSRAA